MHRPLLVVTVLAFVGLTPSIGHATPNFPDVIEQTVATMGPPPCSLCHQADVRNNYSVKTPFGAALKARGLVPEDEASLQAALESLRSDKADSDYDGMADIDELEAGRDPNLPGDLGPGPKASYGCTVRDGNASSSSLITFTLAALAVAWRGRARSRRRAT